MANLKTNKKSATLASLLLMLLLVVLGVFIYARWITSPVGIFLFSAFYIAFYAVIGWLTYIKSSNYNMLWLGCVSVACLFVLPITAWHYKKTVLRIDVYHIPSGSMSPTVVPGDYVLVDLSKTRIKKLKKQDIIVYYNQKAGRVYIKRIVQITNGSFMIEGDNRGLSASSKVLGSVQPEQIIGAAEMILLNPHHLYSRTLKALK